MLSDKEELLLQQLRLLKWLDQSSGPDMPRTVPSEDITIPQSAPPVWDLLPDVQLSAWQIECRKKWFQAGFAGTVKVVTGAGKTILALGIIQSLQNEIDRDLRVAIVVPTIVLLNQWYDRITQHSNLPASAVGRLGGGFKDDLAGPRRILIAVLDSAQTKLPQLTCAAAVEGHLLLIVDECHHAGAPETRRVLSTPRAYSLGLSATPERLGEDEDGKDFDESILGRQLGGIVFELTLGEALRLGVVPPYTIRHYGLPLAQDERFEYEKLSRAIADARRQLKGMAPSTKGHRGFFAWVQRAAIRSAQPGHDLASRFLLDTTKRKQLLFKAEARTQAVVELLGEFRSNSSRRAILFHENIDSINQLFVLLKDKDFPVVLEHSELPRELRDAGLDLFRRGLARIIVSARSLIEGFNVPAVDMGIIVASSTSSRQRIQSMGRLLRKHLTDKGEEKNPVIHILYIRDTVDDAIYGQEDWERLTGAEQNEFFTWVPGREPQRETGPPHVPLPRDTEIELKGLRPGEPYPGRLEGEEYSCDSQGNLKSLDGSYLSDPYGIAKSIIKILGRSGRFFVTPKRFHVVVRVPEGGEWTTRLVQTLPGPLPKIEPQLSPQISNVNRDEWLLTARPGDLYLPGDVGAIERVKFSQKRGGVIARKVPSGEVFVRTGTTAKNATLGADADRLLAALHILASAGAQITHLEINKNLDAVYRRDGRIYFLATLLQGLEFPEV
jgi:superfamily II DNA or RNA helicase